jgi:hypothetical protein
VKEDSPRSVDLPAGLELWMLTIHRNTPHSRYNSRDRVRKWRKLRKLSVFTSIGPPLFRSIPPGGSVTSIRIA